MHSEQIVTGRYVDVPAGSWLVATLRGVKDKHGAIGWYEDVVGSKYLVIRQYGTIADTVALLKIIEIEKNRTVCTCNAYTA